MTSIHTILRYTSYLLLFMLLLMSVPIAFAGAPHPQFPPASEEYDLVILNPNTGEQKVFRMNDYIRLNYDQFPDNPVKNQTLRLSGNLQEVTNDAIKIDGTWIAISSITHISRPTINGSQMTKRKMNLNIALIPFFPLLMVFSFYVALMASLYGGQQSQSEKLAGGLGLVGFFTSLVMIPISILMQPGIKWKVNKKRILLSKLREE